MKRKNNNHVVVSRFPNEDIEELIERFNFRMLKHGKGKKLPQDLRFISKGRKGAIK